MLMLSVLIVDDERAICYLIRKLIHWEELGLIYAGSASDGWEAWSMAQEKRPDIIITDIQMPKMNGMELIERFREEKIPTDFVVVSGYQEFEYAKQAIRFGVEDYLLKPIKEAELNRILKRICEKSQENSEIVQLKQEQQRRKNRVLEQILRGEPAGADAEEDFRFRGDHFLLAQFQFCFSGEGKGGTEAELLLERLRHSYMNEFSGEYPETEALRTEKDQLTFFLNHENGSHFAQKNQSFFDKMQVKYAGTPFAMVITEKSHSLKELSSVALRMRRLMRAASCAGRERMLILEEFRIPGPEEQVQIPPDLRIELVRLLDRKDAETGWKYVEAMLKKERARQADFPWSMFELAEILLDVLEDSMKELKLWDKSMDQLIGEAKRNLPYLSGGRLFPDLADRLRRIWAHRDRMRQEMENRPVSAAKLYVAEHYREPVTMEDAAAWVGLNSAYFSSLFKKSEGVTFTEYLTSVRMEKAKYYLAETSCKVNEIAEKVGYTDAKYVSAYWTDFVRGLIILIAITFDAVRKLSKKDD